MSETQNETPVVTEGCSDSTEAIPRRTRSKIWLFPCGCVLIVLLLGAGAAGFLWNHARKVRSTEAYQTAVAEAMKQPLIHEKLGENLKPTGWAGGRINQSAGTAEIGFVLEGHRGGGKIRVKLAHFDGTWIVKTMDFQVSGQEKRYELIPSTSPTGKTQSTP